MLHAASANATHFSSCKKGNDDGDDVDGAEQQQ